MQTFSIKCPQPNSRSNKRDHSSWASWLYYSDSGVAQHMQINNCNSSCKCAQVKKWHGCLNKHRKCLWQNPTALHFVIELWVDEMHRASIYIIKSIEDKPTDNIILNGEKSKMIPPQLGTRPGYLFSTFILNKVFSMLDRAIWQEKKKEIQAGKEVKISLFAVDMIIYRRDPKDSTKIFSELENNFTIPVFLYTSDIQTEK